MSETPISPLRRRMIEDMSLRNFGEKTQNDTDTEEAHR
jgi:integrase/recombinase XerD